MKGSAGFALGRRRSTEQSTCRGNFVFLLRLWCVAPTAFAPIQWLAMTHAYSRNDGWRDLFPLAWSQPAVFPLALDIFGQNGLMHARTLTAPLIVCACLYAFVAYACFHTHLVVDHYLCVCALCPRPQENELYAGQPRALDCSTLVLLSLSVSVLLFAFSSFALTFVCSCACTRIHCSCTLCLYAQQKLLHGSIRNSPFMCQWQRSHRRGGESRFSAL